MPLEPNIDNRSGVAQLCDQHLQHRSLRELHIKYQLVQSEFRKKLVVPVLPADSPCILSV